MKVGTPGFIMKNIGIGPAYIKKISCRVDGDPVLQKGKTGIKPALDKLGIKDPFFDLINYYELGETDELGDVALRAGGEEELISYKSEIKEGETYDRFIAAMKRLEINVKYESFYGEEFIG